MVVLAQALVSRPKFMLVDELSLGLAPVVVQRLCPAIENAVQDGVGVLLIEQFVHVALKLAEDAYVIENGRIVQHRPTKELRETPGAAALRVPAPRAAGRRRAARRCRVS